MDRGHDAAREVDLVLFEVGGRVFGSDASEVMQVGRFDSSAPVAARLGRPSQPRRVLWAKGVRGPVQVPIDRLVGFRRVSVGSLRRLPDFARGLAEPALVGFLVEGDTMLLLIDLEALINEGLAGASDSPGAHAASGAP